MTNISNYYEVPPLEGDASESLVIFLHGYGSNGQDLISLAPLFASALPRTQFVSPDAPFELEVMPGMHGAYQWFSLLERTPEKMLAGAQMAAPILEEFLQDMMEKFSVPAEKTALVGFSQGTMMSLYTAPRFEKAAAGVLGYSGALIGGESLIENSGVYQSFPVCLIHGEADDVVPVQACSEAENTLKKAGYAVSGHTTPGLTHSIDQAGIDAGISFLRGILSQV